MIKLPHCKVFKTNLQISHMELHKKTHFRDAKGGRSAWACGTGVQPSPKGLDRLRNKRILRTF